MSLERLPTRMLKLPSILAVRYKREKGKNPLGQAGKCPEVGPRGAGGKEPACQSRRQETRVQFLSWEDPLEEDKTTRLSVLPWRTPWTEEPGGPRSTGLRSWTRPQ